MTLRLTAGGVLGLMGPNGSGKTTLLRLLATASTPTAGQIRWFGNSNPRDPSVRRRLGTMLDQAAHFDQMSGYQNAWFFAHQFGLSDELSRDRLDELFHWAGLWDAREQLVGEYSLGMKRKLNLIEALVHRPSILLLDEPTLALDYRAELDLIERLQLLSLTGTAVVLATNDVHLAERLCDYVLFLHEGRVIREGRVPDLLTEVAGSKEVQLEVNSPVPLESLRRLAAVEAASVDGDTVHIILARGANPAQVLAVLNGTADLVSTMRVRRPNLGDLFLKLTGVALPAAHR
ncbi:MAG TPA: ABC transporter ATP-binding protein [Candidatus Dormibacteraeota bacterium]|nr:ABC transporter ATP-binding protein [Candidatus Dormibacteraeota bacterium]